VNLDEVDIQIVRSIEEKRFQELMQLHHYLNTLPKIGETLWYVATLAGQWVALLSFSAPALKCSHQDRWIGWDFRHQYDRLKLLTNNSRFLILYGITSHTSDQADPKRVLKTNRDRWSIENSFHYIIDWNFDEDRSRICTGYGPDNMTSLPRFAISLIKSKGVRSAAQKMRQLTRNVRTVFDYLHMTQNSVPSTRSG